MPWNHAEGTTTWTPAPSHSCYRLCMQPFERFARRQGFGRGFPSALVRWDHWDGDRNAYRHRADWGICQLCRWWTAAITVTGRSRWSWRVPLEAANPSLQYLSHCPLWEGGELALAHRAQRDLAQGPRPNRVASSFICSSSAFALSCPGQWFGPDCTDPWAGPGSCRTKICMPGAWGWVRRHEGEELHLLLCAAGKCSCMGCKVHQDLHHHHQASLPPHLLSSCW